MVMNFRFFGILIIILFTAFSSCDKRKIISGKDFVPHDVMVDVLVDLHLMDAITNDRKFHRRYEADSIDLEAPIFIKYGITQTMFDTTLSQYSKHPEQLDQIYNEVLIKLNVMLDENDKLEH